MQTVVFLDFALVFSTGCVSFEAACAVQVQEENDSDVSNSLIDSLYKWSFVWIQFKLCQEYAKYFPAGKHI